MKFTLAIALLSGLAALAAANPLYRAKTIVDVLAGDARFKALVGAVSQYPDLVEALSSTAARLTVFAPVNAAFEALPEVPSKETLKQILSYHVVGAVARSTDLSEGQLIPTLYAEEGLDGKPQVVKVSLTDGVQINNANVIQADVSADNGVIHVIDAVLLPPANIVNIAASNPDFSILVKALKYTNLVPTVLDAKAVTVFAPTDAAFAKLPAGVRAFLFTALGRPILARILEYHVLPALVYSSAIPSTAARVPTLLGPNVTAQRTPTGVVINGNTNVIAADVIAKNGVIHVIDEVLLPVAEILAAVAQAQETSDAIANKKTTFIL